MDSIQSILEKIHQRHRHLSEGHPATYIPELAKANPQHFAIAVVAADGQSFQVGDVGQEFSMQSTSKPFSYGMALQEHGRDFMLSKIGVEPTGEAFNSIVELEKHTHRPYNPMINSGAIVVSGMIKGPGLDARAARVLEHFGRYLGKDLRVDDRVYESERKTAHRNRSIAHLLRHFGVLDSDIDETLDLYFKQCSILVTTQGLATMAATLANQGRNPLTQELALEQRYVGDVLGLMFTCGMYDSSGEWAYNVGIPAKSGVSGAIFGVVPGQFGIAVYSPPIDEKGHSVRGLRVFQDLSQELALSIFR